MSNLLQIHEPGQTPEPHEHSVAVGIDLGTTHSVIACIKNGEPLAIENHEGISIIPSIVAEGDERIASIKRLMGITAKEVEKVAPQLTELLTNKGEDAIPRLKWQGNAVTPIELSAKILASLKAIAEERLGEDVNQAVITVPAYFDDAARTATKDAAALVGLDVLRLINEPTAAAFAYGLENQAEGVYAIYDFGGGTFDVSLLHLEQGVFQVLATGGDTALGGDDVDHLIAEAAGLEVTSENLMAARRAKEALSDADSHDIGTITLTKEKLAELIAPLIERTLKICDSVFEDANVHRTAIQGVVLVGGSTRLEALQKAVARYFGQPPLKNVDPDRVVAFGAAAQAEQLTQGGDNLLLDVTPLSLGLETMGGIVEKVIWRNTPTPTTMQQEFTTYQDGQTAMDIHVLQGEREMVADCRSLGRFTLHGIPPMTAGSARITITFAIDTDGLLTVAAEETTTGTKQQIEVKPSYGLPLEEMEQMLRDSMVNAEGDIMERLLREARVEAERTLLEIKSAMAEDAELLTVEESTAIIREMDAVAAAMLGEDRDMIDVRHQQLQHVIGPFAQKRMDKAIAAALHGQSVDAI